VKTKTKNGLWLVTKNKLNYFFGLQKFDVFCVSNAKLIDSVKERRPNHELTSSSSSTSYFYTGVALLRRRKVFDTIHAPSERMRNQDSRTKQKESNLFEMIMKKGKWKETTTRDTGSSRRFLVRFLCSNLKRKKRKRNRKKKLSFDSIKSSGN
jgi:hypothetical protein